MRKQTICICENKDAVTAQLISAFVFATRIVLFLFYLYPKFQASTFMLSLYSLVCVNLVRNQIVGFVMHRLIDVLFIYFQSGFRIHHSIHVLAYQNFLFDILVVDSQIETEAQKHGLSFQEAKVRRAQQTKTKTQ